LKDYLFVYGTLRKGYDLPLKRKIGEGWIYIGRARIKAGLIDLGKYPGAIRKGRGQKGEVIGDVYLINDPGVLALLDRYEGFAKNDLERSEFVRRRHLVPLDTGKRVYAWIYWYHFDPGGKPEIRHKDYLQYLKNKNHS
jgi:gamma-glutamylcyclotransferase (GGCT)/AIG2-like uncharacterized protein YtfP